jgi:AIR synthase-related protein
VLFAAEGMRAEFVASDPWFAGFCAVMVNVSDVAAMGGRPWAIVDVLFLGSGDNSRVLEGMSKASEVFGVPVVGGHTARVNGGSMLAAAVIGRARRPITSFGARPGQTLVMAVDLRGSFRGPGGNFNAATATPAKQLRAALAVLPELAEADLVRAGKDISMAGLCGTVGMLIETSGVGATIDLMAVPSPPDVDPERWLTAFPSYGYVLAVNPADVPEVCARFDAVGVTAAAIGEVTSTRRLELRAEAESTLYLDLEDAPLTGFGA